MRGRTTGQLSGYFPRRPPRSCPDAQSRHFPGDREGNRRRRKPPVYTELGDPAPIGHTRHRDAPVDFLSRRLLTENVTVPILENIRQSRSRAFRFLPFGNRHARGWRAGSRNGAGRKGAAGSPSVPRSPIEPACRTGSAKYPPLCRVVVVHQEHSFAGLSGREPLPAGRIRAGAPGSRAHAGASTPAGRAHVRPPRLRRATKEAATAR